MIDPKKDTFEFATHFVKNAGILSMNYNTDDFEVVISELTPKNTTNAPSYDFIRPIIQSPFTTENGKYKTIFKYNETDFRIEDSRLTLIAISTNSEWTTPQKKTSFTGGSMGIDTYS